MTQIGVLTTDEQLLDMLRASGLKVEQIDAIDFANFSRTNDAPAAVVLARNRRWASEVARSSSGSPGPTSSMSSSPLKRPDPSTTS